MQEHAGSESTTSRRSQFALMMFFASVTATAACVTWQLCLATRQPVLIQSTFMNSPWVPTPTSPAPQGRPLPDMHWKYIALGDPSSSQLIVRDETPIEIFAKIHDRLPSAYVDYGCGHPIKDTAEY